MNPDLLMLSQGTVITPAKEVMLSPLSVLLVGMFIYKQDYTKTTERIFHDNMVEGCGVGQGRTYSILALNRIRGQIQNGLFL